MSCLWEKSKNTIQNDDNKKENDLDLSNWMGQYEKDLRGKRLNQIAIPGSHDAGSFKINTSSERCPSRDDLKILSKICPCIVAKWAKTQKLDFNDQLKSGSRYFDLRGCKSNNGEILFTHGLMEGEFLKGLKVLCDFAKTHVKEILILDIRFLRGLTAEDHIYVKREIEKMTGNQLAEKDMLQATSPFWQFIESGRTIVVIYPGIEGINHSKFWSNKSTKVIWPNTTDSSVAINKLNESLDKRNINDLSLFVLQATLTPNTNYLIFNFCQGIENLSDKINQKLVSLFNDECIDKINVAMYDFIEYPGLAESIINQNFDC